MPQINTDDLFLDTVYADIIFVVDKEEIPGHRLVLAKTCPYFDKLLFGDFMESNSKKVDITRTSANVFTEVMRYTYKGQLAVKEWTIEDLMSLLAVAHEYQFQPLFCAVIKAVEEKPLDFDSWPLVNAAASLYDSEDLRRKSSSFTEENIDEFLRGKNLEKFSADFLCCMLDCPKMSTFNQDHVVRAICNWKKGQSSPDIIPVLQKINWENVSPKFTAIVLTEFFETVKKVKECKFWSKLSTAIDGSLESNACKDCIIRVDSVVLSRDFAMTFALPDNRGNFFCGLLNDRLVFWFRKELTEVEIPVKRIEFEVSTNVNISEVWRWGSEVLFTQMVGSELISNKVGSKFNAVFPDAEAVSKLHIYSEDFENMAEISLKNIVIY